MRYLWTEDTGAGLHFWILVYQLFFDNELGKLNSDAKIAARESEKYRTMFLSLLETVIKEVQHEAAVNP